MGYLALLTAVLRIRLRLHVFGHIHATRGTKCVRVRWDESQRLYERIVLGEGGWWSLLMPFDRVPYTRVVEAIWGKGTRTNSSTIMVNAGVHGGWRDQENVT